MSALEISIVDSDVLKYDDNSMIEKLTVSVNGKQYSIFSEKKLLLSDWDIYLPTTLSRISKIKTAIMLQMFDFDPTENNEEL